MSDPKEWTYEQSLERLKTVVEQLERGNLGLEESLSLYEEGVRLSALCERKLSEVEARVRVLIEPGQEANPRKDLPLDFVANVEEDNPSANHATL